MPPAVGACGGDGNSGSDQLPSRSLLVTEQALRSVGGAAEGSGTTGEQRETGEFPHTPRDVIRIFARADVPLLKVYEDDLSSLVLLDRKKAAKRIEQLIGRYGIFTIAVAYERPFLDSLLTDDAGNKIKPDAAGVYWEFHEEHLEDGSVQRYWLALKPFENVVLQWAPSTGEKKQTDETWNRLNELLGHLPK